MGVTEHRSGLRTFPSRARLESDVVADVQPTSTSEHHLINSLQEPSATHQEEGVETFAAISSM